MMNKHQFFLLNTEFETPPHPAARYRVDLKYNAHLKFTFHIILTQSVLELTRLDVVGTFQNVLTNQWLISPQYI